MFHQNIVHSPAVREGANRLPSGTGDAAEGVAGGVKNQRASFRQEIRTESPFCGGRQTHHETTGSLMDIGLNPRQSPRPKIFLAVPVIAVYGFGREPTIEMIAIPN